MDVYVDGARVRLDPAHQVGKGGEAEVYPYGPDGVIKVFKTPDHPDLHGLKTEQAAARERLDEHQRKLRAFPNGLPVEVIVPEKLATDRRGKQVLGYTMRRVSHAEPLLRLSDPVFRRAFSSDDVRNTFLRLHAVVEALHRSGVVIGDFNDLNVLVRPAQLHLIDADSFQFAPFLSRVFTERFLDPRLMDRSAPVLSRPYDPDADWFAFSALLFQSLLFVGPWGGIHRPKAGPRLSASQRPLQRLSVLHGDVQYPRPARTPASLPDAVLHHFEAVFHRDARGAFPPDLLRALTFFVCPSCGLEHARGVCPVCRPHAQAPLRTAITVRGSVTARTLFDTDGIIVAASVRHGGVRVVSHQRGRYVSDGGAELVVGKLDPADRFLWSGKDAWHLRHGVAACGTQRLIAHRAAANETGLFWISGGTLQRHGSLGPERIGDVVEQTTCFDVGARFGAGFYRAGNCTVVFTFDTQRGGLREDSTALRLREDPIEVRSSFSDTHGWLLLTLRSGERQLLVLDPTGAVLGRSSAIAPEWLTSLRADPVAVGPWLFVPTDTGVVRVELANGDPVITREFPDTEPFVDSATPLLFDGTGLIAVQPRRVLKLQMQ